MNSLRIVVTAFAFCSVLVAGCSREQGDWRSAQAADTVESYNQFLAQHPDSQLAGQARERVAQLTEEADWQKAATTDSLETYQQFLARHPNGKWSKEARIRIENFAVTGILPAPTSTDSTAATNDSAGGNEVMPPANPVTRAYGVQLGAFSSSDRANAEWQRIAAKYPGPLEGLAPRVVAVESGGKALYRLQASVMDEAQARAVCGALKQGGQGCVVVLP